MTTAEVTPAAWRSPAPVERRRSMTASKVRAAGLAAMVALTVWIVVACIGQRFHLAAALPWQCDEIPMLVRFTGLCGYVANESQAADFTPSYYTTYMGALRSLKAPSFYATLHTTTGFWTNLTVHAFGVTPAAGRIMPLAWSIVGVVVAGAGAWVLTRRWVATLVAVIIVAASPHAVAYGAQARGYSEALALAPLLLIALELWRRRPASWLRGLIVAGIALQLSLTVYTAWVYVVFPLLLLALYLPSTLEDRATRRVSRGVIVPLVVCVIAFMGLFTVDRWSALTRQGAIMGDPLTGWSDAAAFAAAVGRHLFVWPVAVIGLAVLGCLLTWRTKQRWWVVAILLTCAMPAAFAVANGSVGYPRNLGYLTGLLAIPAGAGAARLMEIFSRRGVAVPGAVVGLVALCSFGFLGVDSAVARSGAILLPDWGEAVTWMNRQPAGNPRWICPDLANHWQIEWYGPAGDCEDILEIEPGGSLEVLFGAQLNEHGQPTVFRHEPGTMTIPQVPLPGYLSAMPPSFLRAGIEWRRWTATRLDGKRLDPVGAPVLVMGRGRREMSPEDLSVLLQTEQGADAGVIDFKPMRCSGELIFSFLVPGKELAGLARQLCDTLNLDLGQLRVFSLGRSQTGLVKEDT